MVRSAFARVAPLMPAVQLQLYPGHTAAEFSLIQRYFDRDPAAEPGFIVDRLGVRTRVASLWDGVAGLSGTVIPLPLEADFHAEAVEWIGVLKAVDTARKRFVAMELGAGWGPWLVAGATAARRRGITALRLLGVEADPVHFAAMQQHFRDNGIDPADHVLLHAAVGGGAGRARFPRSADARNDWGQRPDADARAADMIEVDRVAIGDLIFREPVWDLVHIDVQGGEAELCRAAVELLGERVRWLVIGTHSRVIEGELVALLHAAGWQLENEKPARVVWNPAAATLEAMTTHDGTQVWRNVHLT
jgi:FkbM family methyltransferase